MTLENIPAELAAPAKWISYALRPDKKGKLQKKPNGKWGQAGDTAEQRKALGLRSLDGWIASKPIDKNPAVCAGYQRWVDPDEGFIFIDLDHCRNPQTCELESWAEEIVESFRTYTEISPSGTGLRLVCRGRLPADFYVPGNPVEIYSGHINKLMAMTGNLLNHDFEYGWAIEDRQAESEALLNKHRATTAPASAPEYSEELIVECMKDVKEEDLHWLWYERVLSHALNIFTGNPETGKTTTYCDIAARVSRGLPFPHVPTLADGRPVHDVRGNVLILSAEDTYAHRIKPLLMAAGADLDRIFFIKKVEIRQGAKRRERMLALSQDLEGLEQKAIKHNFQLIIIDPISSYFGKGNLNNEQDVRAVLGPLVPLAEHAWTAIIGVGHFNKDQTMKAIHKASGSGAIVALPRSVQMFSKVPDEDDQYVMHFVKCNSVEDSKKFGIRFTFGAKKLPTLTRPVPCIIWGEKDTGTADDVLQEERGLNEGRRAARAEKFLKEYLTEEKSADEVMAEAKKRNISRDALYEVKKELGIKADKHGGKEWFWCPPEKWPD